MNEFKLLEMFSRNAAYIKKGGTGSIISNFEEEDENMSFKSGGNEETESILEIKSNPSKSLSQGKLDILLNKKGFIDLIFLQKNDLLSDYQDSQLYEKIILTYCSRDKLMRMLLIGYEMYMTPRELFLEIMKRYFFLEYQKTKPDNKKYTKGFIELNQKSMLRFLKIWK